MDSLIRILDYRSRLVIDTPSTSAPGGIQVLRRANAVLRLVSDHQGHLRLVDVASTLGLPKTTVHRIVAALTDDQMLRIDPHGLIWLGPALVSLGRAAVTDLGAVLRPVLDWLADRTGETVDLAVLDGRSARFIDQIPSGHRLQAVSTVGAAFPLHCSANGKALLAALPPDRLDELLPRRLEALTPHTITDRAQLYEQLKDIRGGAVAVDREEHSLGIRALGVAVSDQSGPLAAISIPVPAERFGDIEDDVAHSLQEAATRAAALFMR